MTIRSPRVTNYASVSVLLVLSGCSGPTVWNGSVEDLLRSQPERFATVMQEPDKYRIQVIYTQIDRDAENRPTFTTYSYRVNTGEYFYPASTVKLPTALLALEKINGLDGVDRDTPMLTGTSAEFQTPATADMSSPTGLPSIGHYIRKILLVSDNDAFNRIYEFLGQEPLNEAMRSRGFSDTRIMHRLEVPLSVEENRLTNPVRFVSGDETIFEQGPQYSSKSYVDGTPIMLGRAEIVGDQLLQRPKDFSEKNAFPLQDLHNVLQALMFPDAVEQSRRFNLTDDDYRFVYSNMSSYPGDSGIADYSDAAEYPDGYVKFLLVGGKAGHVPRNLRIFNKVGDAYGFLTDAAYLIDVESKIEFILAATIYTNANETFNDNDYEYNDVGFPFLRDLGKAIYELEIDRERLNQPDFSRFKSSE